MAWFNPGCARSFTSLLRRQEPSSDRIGLGLQDPEILLWLVAFLVISPIPSHRLGLGRGLPTSILPKILLELDRK